MTCAGSGSAPATESPGKSTPPSPTVSGSTSPSPADGDWPFWLRSDTGEQHASFCPDRVACTGVCREVVDLDGATAVFSLPAGLPPQVEIATATGRVVLPAEVMTQVARLALARTHPAGIPHPGMRRRPTT